MKLLSVFSSDFLTKIKDRIGLTPSPSNADGQALVVSGGDYTYGYPTQLSTASGSAPSFAARAWVRFNGSTAAINGSGNVSSITKIIGGLYTVNFTTAMEDVNYSVTCSPNNGSGYQNSAQITSITTTSTQIETTRESNNVTLRYDSSTTCCVIHK